jgi:hypothetical protein
MSHAAATTGIFRIKPMKIITSIPSPIYRESV